MALGVGLQEFAEERGGVLAEFAIVWAEGGVEVRIDVEFADDFLVNEDGDNDFGFGFERAGEVAGIGMNIVDDDGFAGGGSGAADALMKRNAGVGSHGAFEGAEDEDVMIAFFFEHVKADPIVASELFVEEGNDGFHEGFGAGVGVGVVGRKGEAIESRDEVGRFSGSGGHEG